MRRALFTEQEVRLATERRLKYLGTAKVSINLIQFEPPLPRDLDPKNLARLRAIFRKNRCRRLDVDNHVPAIVSRRDLAVALQKANISERSLLTNDPHQFPGLMFAAGQLQALHGRHRVQAGTDVLPPADRWWTVDLYLDGKSSRIHLCDIGGELRSSLVEEYANQKKPTDGEIYRKIRQYEGEANEPFRERWFVRLSPSNQDRLDQLDNKRNRRLRRAFDRLLLIPGLWPRGMRISMLHRLIATGCVEEIITYLDYIEDFWSSLVDSEPGLMKKIDPDTVDALQLLAPGKSRNDAKTARGRVLGGQAFAEFSDEERRTIWSRLESFDGLVPSLYTFFEDFKYLESCAHCVRRLFGPSTDSVWETMSSMFIPSSEEASVVQTSESAFRRERAAATEGLDKGYLQVWLYAMRHYPLMPPDPKKDDDLLAKPVRAKADERAIYEMAELAHQLGFKSPEIEAIIDSSPDHQIAREALLQARKPNRFRYNAQQFDTLVNQIVDCFAAATPDQPEVGQDLLADSTVKARARCGMPRTGAHKQDSPFLFLDRLNADIETADTITTFFVRRCVYFAFFGKSARPEPTDYNQTGDSGGDTRWSPMFIGEDGPSSNHGSASRAAEPNESSLQERRGMQVQQGRVRQTVHRRQVSRAGRERRVLKQRRKEKVHRRLRPTNEDGPELMEYEWLSTEHSDPDTSDQGRSSPNLPDAGLARTPCVPPNESPRLERRASSSLYSTYGPIVSQGEDTNSQCTRISLEAVPLERDSVVTPAIEAPNKDGGLREQLQIAQPSSSEPREGEPLHGDPGGQQQVLHAYIDQVMKAQEEQERLEEELERERLEGEFGIQEHPAGLQEKQNSQPGTFDNQLAKVPHTDLGSARTIYPESTQHSPPVRHHEEQTERDVQDVGGLSTRDDEGNPFSSTPSGGAGQTRVAGLLLPPGQVEISFWAFEREEWRQSDCFRVDPSDPSPVERAARKYTWKNYSLYDRNLQSLSPAQCYRAATVDGNNAIFVISEYEEKKLAAEGRLTKDRQLLLLAGEVVSQARDRVGSEPSSPKRRRSLSSEEY